MDVLFHRNRKYMLFMLPILLLEFAVAYALFKYYLFHEDVLPTVLLAGSYSAIVVGTSQLIARDMSTMSRVLAIIGGATLFLCQLVASVSGAYIHAENALPITRLATLWGTTPQDWEIRSSILFGAALNIAGLCYWLSLSFSSNVMLSYAKSSCIAFRHSMRMSRR